MSKENRNIYLQKSEIDKFVKTQVLNYNLAMKKISILVVFLLLISIQNPGVTQGPPVPMGPAKLPQQQQPVIKNVESTQQQSSKQENKPVNTNAITITNTEKAKETIKKQTPQVKKEKPVNKENSVKTNKNEKSNKTKSIKEPKQQSSKLLNIKQHKEDERNKKTTINPNKEDKTQETAQSKTESENQSKKESIVPSQINEYRQQAKFLYNSNNLDASLELFNKIPDEEKISDDWLFIANIAQDKGKPIDAIFYLKKAISLDDNNFKAHYNLGNLYFADNKVNMALNEYRKVLRLKKDYAYAYYNKGCCYLKKKSWFNARYEFGLAIKANPNEPAFYYNLAYTYKMMKKPKKAKEALEMYNKLMAQ